MNIVRTIFCRSVDTEIVKSLLQGYSTDIDIKEENSHWISISARLSNGKIKLSILKGSAPMDRFSKLTLGMMTWIHKRSKDQETIRDLQTFIASCDSVIGCVFESEVSGHEDFENCVLNIASQLFGVIFDGVRLVNDKGELLLE